MPRRAQPRIRIGVGGWTYQPWRETFYPGGLTHSRELAFASSKLSSIEVNGTYYRTQSRETFQKWHDETPEDFVFSIKAPRFITARRTLADAAPSIERFLTSGIILLRDKLGPINWQFLPTRKFDPDDMAGFLKLLPDRHDGQPLRHALEVRHDSFRTPAFVDLARQHGVAIVIAGDSPYPMISDVTAPFVYVRIMGTIESEVAGYPDEAIERWAERAATWASGGTPRGLESDSLPKLSGRDVFLYVISGFKARNPAAALALIEKVAARSS